MFNLNNIYKTFNKGMPNEEQALKGITLAINSGEITVLKGPSGSGKTTLLSIIGCMSRPTSGRIIMNDLEITSLPERFLARIRRSKFGFIFQHYNLIRGISAIENIMIPSYPSGEDYTSLKEKASHLLEDFGLLEKASSKVEWLSGGEAQRVAIARALINNPSVIIADEPTAHLDTALSREFMQIMEQLNNKGKTIIIASHDPEVYEFHAVDRVVIMRDGKILND